LKLLAAGKLTSTEAGINPELPQSQLRSKIGRGRRSILASHSLAVHEASITREVESSGVGNFPSTASEGCFSVGSRFEASITTCRHRT
jgi:hypothetical protein